MPPEPVRTGLDRLAVGEPEVKRFLSGRRVGLLAHPASVDRRLVHAREVLSAAGCAPTVLFGPEHGFDAAAQDMVGVASAGGGDVPVRSLYGDSEMDLSPRPEWLADLDVVVVDLQDVGSRYYTYVWTAACMLNACARAGVQTLVLDRPNPLGGERVEGGPQRAGYRSFVGMYDVAVRHGMTIGELCRMVQALEGIAREALTVVPMLGWARSMHFDATGLPWVMPSPNMPTLDTALVYPGGCLIEGTSLSEGRGTTRPFELWGAPGLDGKALSERVRCEGAVLRPVVFQPTFHKHGGLPCGGVQVHVTDRGRFSPYRAYLELIAGVRGLLGAEMAWRTAAYEFITDRPAIDLLTGGPEYRTAVDAGEDLHGLIAADRRAAAAFEEARRSWLLY